MSLDRWKSRCVERAAHGEAERVRRAALREYVIGHLDLPAPANANRPRPAERPRDGGMSLATTLKRGYVDGLSLWLPGERDWLLKPEQFMHADVSVGTFDEPVPLAVIGALDPTPVMALAASARLAQRARVRRELGEICREVRGATEHETVHHVLKQAELDGFSLRAVEALRRSVSEEINQIRTACFEKLKGNLAALIENRMDPLPFAEEFFALSEMSHIRTDAYRRMVLSLLMSPKVRPGAKLMVLQRFDRFPRALQIDIVQTIAYAERSPSNDYVKEELLWMVQRSPEILRRA